MGPPGSLSHCVFTFCLISSSLVITKGSPTGFHQVQDNAEIQGQSLVKEAERKLLEYVLQKMDSLVIEFMANRHSGEHLALKSSEGQEPLSDPTASGLRLAPPSFCETMTQQVKTYEHLTWQLVPFPLFLPVTLPLFLVGYAPLRLVREVSCINVNPGALRHVIGNAIHAMARSWELFDKRSLRFPAS